MRSLPETRRSFFFVVVVVVVLVVVLFAEFVFRQREGKRKKLDLDLDTHLRKREKKKTRKTATHHRVPELELALGLFDRLPCRRAFVNGPREGATAEDEVPDFVRQLLRLQRLRIGIRASIHVSCALEEVRDAVVGHVDRRV